MQKRITFLTTVFFLLVVFLPDIHAAQKGRQPDNTDSVGPRVTDVIHSMTLSLDDKDTAYRGGDVIEFKVADVKSVPDLVFKKGFIQTVSLNGTVLGSDSYDRHRVRLPEGLLFTGTNRVSVNYIRLYSHKGSGLYRLTDLRDGKVYVYTKREVGDNATLFPVFDQKDAVASYVLRTEVPEGWRVISSNPEELVTFPQNGKKLWTFKTTKLAPQSVSLAAGPFEMWRDRQGQATVRLFAPVSAKVGDKALALLKRISQGIKRSDTNAKKSSSNTHDHVLLPGIENTVSDDSGVAIVDEQTLMKGK
ncbi:MAG: hypothetical protein HQM16_07120 [Deltaproteobacteria bacterium]|nr:hypothetical protein [Deltaproteobacteria bacterium]